VDPIIRDKAAFAALIQARGFAVSSLRLAGNALQPDQKEPPGLRNATDVA
jgi:hypothetical protein